MHTSPYAYLLDKTCLPNPSFQRFAVVSIFQKLKCSPSGVDGGVDSDTGRDALLRCLTSKSPSVVDQSVRELCRLVKPHGPLDISRGLIELQSALDNCGPEFVDVIVKAIGFLCRHYFQYDHSWGRNFSSSTKLHPFVKVLSCRTEVCDELKRQVLLFIVQCVPVGITAVFEFVRPFMVFSVLKSSSSVHLALFSKDLMSSVAALTCSLPDVTISIIRLLMGCLKFFPSGNDKELKYLLNSTEYVVDALVMAMKKFVQTEEIRINAKKCCMELLDTIIAICSDRCNCYGGRSIGLELSKRLLLACKELGWEYSPDFVVIILSLSVILTQTEVEHEKLLTMKLLIYLMEWKKEKKNKEAQDLIEGVPENKDAAIEFPNFPHFNLLLSTCHIEHLIKAVCAGRGGAFCCIEESLLVFPVMNLILSPSKSVKATAMYLLSTVEMHQLEFLVAWDKLPISQTEYLSPGKPVYVIFRLLRGLLVQEPSLYFIELHSDRKPLQYGIDERSNSWIYQLKHYFLLTAKVSESKVVYQAPRSTLSGMSSLLCTILCFLTAHPELGGYAVDSFSSSGFVDHKASLPLLLTVLFYCKIFCNSKNCSQEILIKLLELLPTLASNSVMMPLIVQAILPMLQKHTNPVLYATAIRLLCKTWMVADPCFGNLQELLAPNMLAEFVSESEISVSIASSVRDVCKQNPDRGVDLILSVSLCIESRDPLLHALGLESLAYLCEADAVDFYTAWNFVIRNLLDYTSEPAIAHSLCILLQWGAMDAEAYSENSRSILEILWEVGTSRDNQHESSWTKARVSAFNSLCRYEVGFVQKNIANFKERNVQFLISEFNVEVLNAVEKFETGIINFEHMTRRRLLKEKKHIVNKVEKLLDIFPRAIFSSGELNYAKELPGATLLSFEFTPKDFQKNVASREIPRINEVYGNKLLEIAKSLHLSRNIFLALLALQSWKAFTTRWMKALSVFVEPGSSLYDKSSKAAANILKIMCRAAEESVPRVAENVALAIGALCMIVQPSAHSIAFTASNFLLKWLFQFEHENRQWSAALSLGLLSNYLHVTDRPQKYDVVTGLLKVLRRSESYLVKGACGAGLGFACQDFLTRIEVDAGTARVTESRLLGKILRSLSFAISEICPDTFDSLRDLADSFPAEVEDTGSEEDASWLCGNPGDIEGDVWGVAGLVLGLGNSVVAIYRHGFSNSVLKIKDILMSWSPFVGSSVNNVLICDGMPGISLSVGSCIILPMIVAFCQRNELISDCIDGLVSGYGTLISELLSININGSFQHSLLMAGCVGVGSLLSYTLSEGIYPLKLDVVRSILTVMRSTYTHAYPPSIHFCGMLGVVNAFGAGAGILSKPFSQPATLESNYIQKDSSYLSGPILRSHALEPLYTSIVQEMFILAKDQTDRQRQKFAAWALSFLQWSKDFDNLHGLQSGVTGSKPVPQSFSHDSLVWKLYMWLMHLETSQLGITAQFSTVTTILVCLRQAPRLPASSDWGPIIRRYTSCASQFSGSPALMESCRILREECINFSLAHAKIEPLLMFLDEQADLPRFSVLELNVQLALLNQLFCLLKVFSASRWEKLCNDLVEYFSSSTSSYLVYGTHQKHLIRTSFWKGLSQSVTETSEESSYIRNIQNCMGTLFSLLPVLSSNDNYRREWPDIEEEWSVAINCLAKADICWVMDMLKVTEMNQEHGICLSVEAIKRIFAISKLVMVHHISIDELRKLKALILNGRPDGMWSVLVEVARVVSQAEGSTIKQWLIDALDISTISPYPSTALQFIGILSGSCCRYMPLLILEPTTILSDLPVTLSSLIEDNGWSMIAQDLSSRLLTSAERICRWASKLHGGDGIPGLDNIDTSENNLSDLLSHVMYQTCVSLKHYMPFEKQLRLANMSVS